jgi:mono/diheme cytochrome c family protein
MRARAKIAATTALLFATAVLAGACGSKGVAVSSSSPYYRGAILFRDHCSGCHTLSVVDAQGSATSIKNRVRTNGPNFNIRKEDAQQVLYAIRNGGFSGAIMPENIVLGEDAQSIASFLAAYSGRQAQSVPTTNIPASSTK